MNTLTALLTSSLLVFSLNSFAEEKVDFVTQVLPVLEKKCMACHREEYVSPKNGRTKKPKSGYRMDTSELIMKSGDENEVNIVAGDANNSPVYKYTTLPENDDWFMPIKGDPLTEEEKALLKNWINQGANLGEWTESKFNPDGTKVESTEITSDADEKTSEKEKTEPKSE